MGFLNFLFGSSSNDYSYEPIHSAWSTCRNCPRLSQAGRLFSAANCIKSSERNYDRIAAHYGKDAEYTYKRIQYAYISSRESWVCCGEAAERGERVAYGHKDGEVVHVDHHVLVVSYQTGSGWFGANWAHILFDNDESYHFDRYEDVNAHLYATYQPDALGSFTIIDQPFSKGMEFFELFDDE